MRKPSLNNKEFFQYWQTGDDSSVAWGMSKKAPNTSYSRDRSHGRYRYHGMLMEALSLFVGKCAASNLHRHLKVAIDQVALTAISVARKAGGRPPRESLGRGLGWNGG